MYKNTEIDTQGYRHIHRHTHTHRHKHIVRFRTGVQDILVLAVLSVVVLAALTGVAMRGAWLVHTAGHMFTWVEVACV